MTKPHTIMQDKLINLATRAILANNNNAIWDYVREARALIDDGVLEVPPDLRPKDVERLYAGIRLLQEFGMPQDAT